MTFSTLQHLLDEVPGAEGLCLFALGAALLALSTLVSTVRAFRAERSSNAVLWISAIASAFVVPFLTWHSAERGRGLLHTVMDPHSGAVAAERVQMMASAINAPLNAIPFGLAMLWGPSLLLGSVAVGVLIAAAWARPWREGVLVMLLWVATGIFPAVLGATGYSATLLMALGHAAELPPGEKGPHILAALDAARPVFALWYRGALIAVALVTLAAAAVWRRRAGARTSATKETLAGCACLVVAGGLFAATAPYRAENSAPVPVDPQGVAPTPNDVRLPALEGPDAISFAPVLGIAANGKLELDGRALAAPEQLDAELASAKTNWTILHPAESFRGSLIVLAETGASTAQLRDLLRRAYGAGYHELQLALGSWRTFQRPLLGTLRRGHFNAALATSALDPPSGTSAALVQAHDFARYDELAAKVVEQRKAGRAVVIVLGAVGL
jgi:hypothetical protein